MNQALNIVSEDERKIDIKVMDLSKFNQKSNSTSIQIRILLRTSQIKQKSTLLLKIYKNHNLTIKALTRGTQWITFIGKQRIKTMDLVYILN